MTNELKKEIEGIPEFSSLRLDPPLTIEEVSKAIYVNWDYQITCQEYPWKATAEFDNGIMGVSVRGKNQEDAIKKLKDIISILKSLPRQKH